jgi:hypothetical protein
LGFSFTQFHYISVTNKRSAIGNSCWRQNVMPHCKKTANRTNGTFGFCRNKPNAEKPKEPFFANAPTEKLTLN